MSKTIFDVDDIYAIRREREAEYASMSDEAARILRSNRADEEWEAIAKMRGIINDWYKCPNILTPQSDRLPAMKPAPNAPSPAK
ncbi:MAG: hypothetical protein LBJ84_01485 [Oscillospiraceae bacterium]|jgi:hypothetical protein|nr:hypothetical protein [Oscillospiraceae bacterium]